MESNKRVSTEPPGGAASPPPPPPPPTPAPPPPPPPSAPASARIEGDEPLVTLHPSQQESRESQQDVEANLIIIVEVDFSDRDVRRKFIRRVYALLVVQLLITATITGCFLFIPPISEFFKRHRWIHYLVLGLTGLMYIVILCCERVRRQVPINFFCLFFCNLLVGVLVGSISATYTINSILLAAGITLAVFFSLTIFSFQTKWDFTLCGGMLCAASISITFFSLFLSVILVFSWRLFTILDIVLATLMGLVVCFYIIYNTQLLLGGKHHYSLRPSEYIYASFNLYTDIVKLFCLILTCCGRVK